MSSTRLQTCCSLSPFALFQLLCHVLQRPTRGSKFCRDALPCSFSGLASASRNFLSLRNFVRHLRYETSFPSLAPLSLSGYSHANADDVGALRSAHCSNLHSGLSTSSSTRASIHGRWFLVLRFALVLPSFLALASPLPHAIKVFRRQVPVVVVYNLLIVSSPFRLDTFT